MAAGLALSDLSSRSERPDLQDDEASRQIALLRFRVRSLAAELDQNKDALAEASIREDHLRAALALALAEREKIFTSKAWRVTRAVQKIIYGPRQFLASMRRFARRLTGALPQPVLEGGLPVSGEARLHAPILYEDWAKTFDTLTSHDRALILSDIASLEVKPVVSLLIREQQIDQTRLANTIASIRQQLYPCWEICLGYDSVITGSFVALLEPGDILPENALYEIIVEFLAHPEAACVYTDEDRIDDQGHRHSPVLKPAFNIDLQIGGTLIGALAVYRCSSLEAIGIASQDIASKSGQMLSLDVAFNVEASRIRHVPSILCHHLTSDLEIADTPDPEVVAAMVARVAPVMIRPLAAHPQWNCATWPLPARLPRVTVIVPTRDRADLLARCVVGLLHRTDYPDLEVLIVDNDSVDAGTTSLFQMLCMDQRVRVVSIPGPFNYSALNNAGAEIATGEILVLLNNDVDVIDRDWLKEMVSHALRPDVGAVGAKLLFANGRIQHAGVVLGVGQHNAGPGVAGHFGLSMDVEEPGYLGQFAITHEVSAVTGACLAVRRDVYDAVGGLDEDNLPVSFNDVDFCLRIKDVGFRIIWTAFAVLYHLESASRGREKTPEQVARAAREADYMRNRWGPVLDQDPFYNQAFDRKDHTFELARRRRRPWARVELGTRHTAQEDS